MPESASSTSGESLLFLTDDQLRKGIEAMFFAYRGFTADPDRILAEKGYGRAHHRAIHFINRSPGTTVNNHLFLTEAGEALERELSTAQRDRMRAAFREAGPEAVAGFRQVLEAMMDSDLRRHYPRLKESSG